MAGNGKDAGSAALAARLAVNDIPVDFVKFVGSALALFLGFMASSFDAAYFGAFGISDSFYESDIVKSAMNALVLMTKPEVLAVFASFCAVSYFILTSRFARGKWLVAWLGVLAISAIIVSEKIGRFLGERAAVAVLEGKNGRIAYCELKDAALSAEYSAAFKSLTDDHSFRLILQTEGALYLANVEKPAKGGDNVQSTKEKLQGSILMVKDEDIDVCRFTGNKLDPSS